VNSQQLSQGPKWSWLVLMSALVHGVLTCSSLYGLQLRYHLGLEPMEIGRSLLWAYLILTFAPLGVLFLKSQTTNLWRPTAVLAALLAGLLWCFGSLSAESADLGIYLHVGLLVIASLLGSLFRSCAQQALPAAKREQRYMILMWVAALAFGLVALANGFWIDDHLYLAFVIFALGALVVAGFLWGQGGTKAQPTLGFSWQTVSLFWRRPLLGLWLVLCALGVMASNSGDMYMAFLLREELGGNAGHVSWAWAVGVLTELPLYLLSIVWLKHFSLRSLLRIALWGITLRMALLAWSPNMALFFIAQALDGFYSGVLLAAFPLWLGKFVNDRRLPLLLLSGSMLYLGLGRAIGGFLSGWIWQEWGLRPLFGVWAIVMFGVCLIALWPFAPSKDSQELRIH
jgi:hypothetical protein